MKAAIYHGISDVRIEETPKPVPGPNQVVFRVKACGVCGTDLHIFHGDPGADNVTPPCVLGHEASGVVESVGEGVVGLSPGDPIVLDPNELCGLCPHCLEGSGHYCTGKKCYGTTYNGAFAEYAVVGAKACHKVAGTLSFEEYAMAEPVACCLHGIDLCKIKPGDSVVVIGAGGIGLIMLQLAKLAGAARTAVLEPSAEKRDLAVKLGAYAAIDPAASDVKAKLLELGMAEPNCVIECVGNGKTILQAIDIVGPCGTVMMFGLTPPDCEIPVKPFDVFKKEIHITSSFINPYTIRRAISVLEMHSINVKDLIATVLPLESLTLALTDEDLRKKGKIVIKP